MEWQPIETAPKDGSNILVYTPSGVVSVVWKSWTSSYADWDPVGVDASYDDSCVVLDSEPTHWRRAPLSPQHLNPSS